MADTTKMLAVGDIGCKSASIDNLANIAESKLPLMGGGDYMYKCHPGDKIGSDRLGDFYAAIQDKVGAKGNHENDGQEEDWAAKTFQHEQGYQAWRLDGSKGELAFIVLDPYQSFNADSKQYKFVKEKVDKFAKDPTIDWIVFVVHEPLWTPDVGGGHPANTDLRKFYEPIIGPLDNAFLLQFHNHVMGAATIANINQAMCGGGGYGGDELLGLNGWDWATDEMGYCSFTFKPDHIEADFIGTDGQVIKHFVWQDIKS